MLLVIAILGAGAWFGKGLFQGTPTSSAPSTQTSTAPASSSPEPTTPDAETTSEAPPAAADAKAFVAECREAWRLQASARNAASVVLTEWDKHLDIMNSLQAGRFDLAKAKELWPATTKDAPAHIAAFHGADTAFTKAGKACTAPEGSTTPEAAAVTACAASMSIGDNILSKARLAVEPWETHLKDQSHFKAGEMTAAKAEALWRSLWQKGLRLNPGYFAAATAGAKASCTLPG